MEKKLLKKSFVLVLLIGILLAFSLCMSQAAETRALWLTRWDATNDTAIQECVNYMVAHKLNTLYVQVYGDGYALYNSTFAPHSYLVASNFDALASAIAKGHAAGIEVHAYINMLNVYSGGLGQPSNPNHLLNTHPEWAMVKSDGVSMMSNVGVSGTMIFFCPENSGFFNYCRDIAVEIAANYNVDGIHLDYIRYPMDIGEYCYCNLHKSNYNATYGHDPVPGEQAWDQWRFDNISNLVSVIYDDVHAVKPLCKVSAATWRSSGVNFQDVYKWLEDGKLDAACPMTYTSDVNQFTNWIIAYNNNSGGRHIYPGIYIPSGSVYEEILACREVGTEGQASFCYGDITRQTTTAFDNAYTSVVPPAPMPWLDGSPDAAPPVLSEIAAVGITGNSAIIKWHSDEKTDSKVEYGLTTSYGITVTNNTNVYDHLIPISNLSPSTTYHYRVTSVDLSGNATVSADQIFATTAGGTADIVIDDGDAGCILSGAWVYVTGAGAAAYNGDYWYDSDSLTETSIAKYTPYIAIAGNYNVYAMWRSGSNRCTSVPYTTYYNGGQQTVYVNQQLNGGVWNLLGTYNFAVGETGYTKVTNKATGGDVVIADAVKFEYAGGGGPTPTPTPAGPTPTPSPSPTPSPTPAPVPAAPSNLVATAVSSTQINLTWTDNSGDETNFIVERKTTGAYSVIATLGPNVTSYSNTGLKKFTLYTYRVKARNAAGDSAYSNEASAKTFK